MKEGFLGERIFSAQRRQMGVCWSKNLGCEGKERMAFKAKAHDTSVDLEARACGEVRGEWARQREAGRRGPVAGKNRTTSLQLGCFCRTVMHWVSFLIQERNDEDLH